MESNEDARQFLDFIVKQMSKANCEKGYWSFKRGLVSPEGGGERFRELHWSEIEKVR